MRNVVFCKVKIIFNMDQFTTDSLFLTQMVHLHSGAALHLSEISC